MLNLRCVRASGESADCAILIKLRKRLYGKYEISNNLKFLKSSGKVMGYFKACFRVAEKLRKSDENVARVTTKL